MTCRPIISIFFFFNDTATTEIYTLSLHDALPISSPAECSRTWRTWSTSCRACSISTAAAFATAPWHASESSAWRSEEHTSELQSRLHLVCRLLLEKKKKKQLLDERSHETKAGVQL